MRALLKRHPFVGSAFLLATTVTLFFGVKMIADAVYWSDPAHRQQPPAEWMTPGYVAHSWKVDRQALRTHLNFNREEIKGKPSLKRIAEAKGVPIETLLSDLSLYLERSDD